MFARFSGSFFKSFLRRLKTKQMQTHVWSLLLKKLKRFKVQFVGFMPVISVPTSNPGIQRPSANSHVASAESLQRAIDQNHVCFFGSLFRIFLEILKMNKAYADVWPFLPKYQNTQIITRRIRV